MSSGEKMKDSSKYSSPSNHLSLENNSFQQTYPKEFITSPQRQQNSAIYIEDGEELENQAKVYHSKTEFLLKFFHSLHNTLFGRERGYFSCASLQNDAYVSSVLSMCIPEHFEHLQEELKGREDLGDYGRAKAPKALAQRKKLEHFELQMFTALKIYFKDKQLDLGELMKQVRVKKMKSREVGDERKSEKIYWQLLFVVFTALYLEKSTNGDLHQAFSEHMESSVMGLRISLEIINSVMKQSSSPYQEEFRQMKGTPIAPRVREVKSGSGESPGQVVITNDSLEGLHMGSLNTDEDEDDDLLKEAASTWDIFDDYHKFEIIEEKRKQKKLLAAREEMKALQKQREEQKLRDEEKNLEMDLLKVENKLKAQEEILKKKGEKEDLLVGQLRQMEHRIEMKEMEVAKLTQKLVMFETIKHKNEVKSKEVERLLNRVEELSLLNGELQYKMMSRDSRFLQLEAELSDLREKQVRLKSKKEESKGGLDIEMRDLNVTDRSILSGATTSNMRMFESPNQRERQGTFMFNEKMINDIEEQERSTSQRVDSLQDELCIDEEKNESSLRLKKQMKPSLDEEELFEGANSNTKAHYRFDTDEIVRSSLISPHNQFRSSLCDDELEPSQMDVELLRKEFLKEREEKLRFLRLNNEVTERCRHYQKMMGEYEQLYGEYLERSIVAEKDKTELLLTVRRGRKGRSLEEQQRIREAEKRNRVVLGVGIAMMAIGVLGILYGILY